MPKKLPKGVRQICFREKTGLFGYSEQISEYGNSSCEDRAGRFCGIRVLQSDSRDAEENLSIEEELTGQAERGVLCLLFWRESGAGFTNVRGVSLARKLFVCLILATDLAVVSTLFHTVPSQRANS